MGIDAELEPQPGGMYWCDVIPGHIAAGEFVELDPPHRLVFTWGWEKSDGADGDRPGTSTIEVELTPEGDGTLLHFMHRDLPSDGGGRVACATAGITTSRGSRSRRRAATRARTVAHAGHGIERARRGERQMAHPVVHFEVAGKDLGKLQQFYGDLFDWKTQKIEGEMTTRWSRRRRAGSQAGSASRPTGPAT